MRARPKSTRHRRLADRPLLTAFANVVGLFALGCVFTFLRMEPGIRGHSTLAIAPSVAARDHHRAQFANARHVERDARAHSTSRTAQPPHIDERPEGGVTVHRHRRHQQLGYLRLPGVLQFPLADVMNKTERAFPTVFGDDAAKKRFDADVKMLLRDVRNPPPKNPRLSALMYEGLEDKHANIAFFVQVSEETLPMLPRLLLKLWHESNVYAVHFDAKIPKSDVDHFAKSLRTDNRFSNVYVMESEPITYMGVTMLLNTLSAIQLLLSKDAKWDYFINISGSDYPLMDVVGMRRLLGQPGVMDRKVNFVYLTPKISQWEATELARFRYAYFDTALGFRKDIDHTLLKSYYKMPMHLKGMYGFTLVQGEAWIIGHRSLCEFSVQSGYARRLLVLMSNMQDPEEHFFQTLAWNHPQFNRTVPWHSLREILWNDANGKAGQHPFPVDRQSETGEWVFWTKLTYSPMFFTRKFRIPNCALMDHVDRMKSGNHEDPSHEAVVYSFGLAKDRFSCLVNADPDEISALSGVSEFTQCFGKANWIQAGCKAGRDVLCLKNRPDLSVPPGPLPLPYRDRR